ncbi:MAG: cadherin domain-containing protein, partial [Planctomycetota bacterium]
GSGAGVLITTVGDSTGTTRNTISENLIYGNAGLGIDIDSSGNPASTGDGVTLNDGGDPDSGANDQQNYPVIDSVQTDGVNVRIAGSLNAAPSSSFRLEFFTSTTGDTSGYGEAERFVGSVVAVTDGAGNATFDQTYLFSIAPDEVVTATATELLSGPATGSTSEFAQNRVANEAPIIVSNGGGATAFINLNENQTAVTTVSATDANVADVMSYSISGGPDQALFTIDPVTGDLLFLTGKDFEIPEDFDGDGVYEVEVTVSDSNGGTDVQTISVTIGDENEAPVDIAPDSFDIDEHTDTAGGVSVGTLTAADPDSGDTFTYAVVGGADAIHFTIGGPSGDQLIIQDGSLDFESQSIYDVVIEVTDSGGLSYTENLTIDVNDLNDRPVDIAPDDFYIDENTDTTGGVSVGTLTATDEDSGETFSYSIAGGPDASHFSIAGDQLLLDDGVLDNENKPIYRVIIRVTDSGGLTYSEMLTVNVNDLNEAPNDINPDSFSIDENIDTSGGTSVGTLLVTDEDAGDSVTYSVIGGADAVSFAIGGPGGDQLLLSDGMLDYERKSTYSVTIRATDAGGLSFDETVTVLVNDLNEPPSVSLTNLVSSLPENVGTTAPIRIADIVVSDDALGVANLSLSGPDSGAFEIVGSQLRLRAGVPLDFETKPMFNVSVRVNDPAVGGTPDDVTSHTLTILDANDDPTAGNDLFFVNEDTALSGNLILNDSDADLNSLSVTLVSAPFHAASLNVQPDGSFNYVPRLDYNGLDTFVYRVDDGVGGSATATVTVTVLPVNDAPTGFNDSFIANANDVLNSMTTILTNDTDMDGDPLVAVLVSGPANGALSLAADGTFVFTPDKGFIGSDSFTYLPVDINSVSGDPTIVNIEVKVGAFVPTNPGGGGTTPGGGGPDDSGTNTDTDPTDSSDPDSDSESRTDNPGDALDAVNAVPVLDLRENVSVSDTADTAENRQDGFQSKESLFRLSDRERARVVLQQLVAHSSDQRIAIEQETHRKQSRLGELGVVYNAEYMWEELEELQIPTQFTVNDDFSIGSITAFATTGYILWSLRGGVLVAAAMSQMPNWRFIDPLPLLDSYSARFNREEESELDEFF